ncbi:MAG TPA: hypothetical protein VE913_17670 [Longimicrobium sp.]|nr:hypothetical protein [Longimicrobium sp.]
MMEMKVYAAAAMVVLSGCATVRAPQPPVRAALNETFMLPIDRAAEVGSDGLVLRFVRVINDSRCPVNARCIRAGSASVALELRAPGVAAGTVTVETPDQPKIADFGPYTVEILDIQPGREIPARALSYTGAFVVRRR